MITRSSHVVAACSRPGPGRIRRIALALFVAGASAVVLTCSETTTSSIDDGGPADGAVITLPSLVVSNAMGLPPAGSPTTAGIGELTWVSLPPGTLTGFLSLHIRNVTTRGPSTDAIPIVDGGFDPVAVQARESDELELALSDADGVIHLAFVAVPRRRPPAIVRTSPAGGRTDVALDARPAVIFTEPIDPATLTPGNVRLTTGGIPVSGSIRRPVDQPWRVEFVPDAPLRPATEYALEITAEVRDLQGDALEQPSTVEFATIVVHQIAFVRWNIIHLANGDGSQVTPLTKGFSISWSPDGRKLAFSRVAAAGSEIRVINVDGTGEVLLTEGSRPSWSPDGTRILFVKVQTLNPSGIGGLFVMDADGSNITRLVPDDPLGRCGPDGSALRWSPDGNRIAYTVGTPEYETPNGVCVMNADGSGARSLTTDRRILLMGAPIWSPDGSTIAVTGIDDVTRVPQWIAIATYAAVGQGPPVVLRTGPLNGPSVAYALDWSPDGSELGIRLRTRSPCCDDGIHALDIATGALRRLVPNPDGAMDFDMQWSPVPPGRR